MVTVRNERTRRVPVALHFVDAIEGIDLLRPRVVDAVGEDELAEVDVERPASAKRDMCYVKAS